MKVSLGEQYWKVQILFNWDIRALINGVKSIFYLSLDQIAGGSVQNLQIYIGVTFLMKYSDVNKV